MSLSPQHIRKDFPLFSGDRPLIYLDNAATTQKPQSVIDSITNYYNSSNANIHRGAYTLAMKATNAYEAARVKIQQFINAQSEKEIIFTRGTTEAMNLLVTGFARPRLQSGDNLVISGMEHHSNLIPWQMLCQEKGAELRVIPMNEKGELDLAVYEQLLDDRTQLVSVVHISNSLGTINPVEEMIHLAHKKGIPVAVDGAQSVAHQTIDVQKMGCDFFAFSGHKLFGPTGIGALYGKKELLDAMTPYQYGGEMIRTVTYETTTFNQLPYKFEAGTPNIAGAIGLGAAIDYVNEMGMENIQSYTSDLLEYATGKILSVNGLRIIGEAKAKSSIISFTLDPVHPHDIGTILNESNIAIRTGHHCTQTVMQAFKIPGTARASMTIYNTREEIDQLVVALGEVKKIFA